MYKIEITEEGRIIHAFSKRLDNEALAQLYCKGLLLGLELKYNRKDIYAVWWTKS